MLGAQWTVTSAVAQADPVVQVGGTMVVIEGPRFSTRAESRHYAAQGWSLINMTGHPEAVLARELRQCYAAIALVTDMDAGADTGEGVGQAEVFELFARNLSLAPEPGITRGFLNEVAAVVPKLDTAQWEEADESGEAEELAGADGEIAAESAFSAAPAMIVTAAGATEVMEDGPYLEEVEAAIERAR